MALRAFPPRGTHPKDLAPTNPLVMWAFSDLSDPRWKFTKKYMVLTQDPEEHRTAAEARTVQPAHLGSVSARNAICSSRNTSRCLEAVPGYSLFLRDIHRAGVPGARNTGSANSRRTGRDSGARRTLDPPSQREDFFMDRRGTGSRNPAVAVAGLKKRNPFTGVRSLDN